MLPIAYAPIYKHHLPAGHRFPMLKYELLPEQLLHQGLAQAQDFFAPEPIAPADLLLVHEAHYWQRLHTLQLTPAEVRRSGFPLSEALVLRERVIAQGTLQCAELALQHGAALNIAGGTHHAYADRAEGFCLLNDQAIAAQWLLARGLARRILIIDLDVHQGNGTADIFANNPAVFTFSMHGADNYPMHKAQSSLDVALPSGTTDGQYLAALAQHLPRALAQHQPDFCFYLAGADVLATDALGKLGLSLAGARQRCRYVYQTLRVQRLPVVTCMGGGYSPRIQDIVDCHSQTFAECGQVYG